MTDYFDRTGQSITQDQWQALMKTPDYDLVGSDLIGAVRVKTRWQGYDSRNDPPRLFETTVYGAPREPLGSSYLWVTEEQATKGHEFIVTRLRLRKEALDSGMPSVLTDGVL